MGPFYPFAWLGLLMPVVAALGVAAALHAVGTTLTVAWLARGRGAGPVASALAGAAVGAGPLGTAAFVDAQVDAWPTFLWLPVVLGSLDRAEGPRRRRWLGLAAAALALLLLGSHLRLSVAACGLLGLWVLLRGRDRLGGLGALALGLMAGAPGWLPMALEARSASRGGLPDLLVAVDQGLGLHALGGWVAPSVFVVARDVGLGAVLAFGLVAGLLDRRRRREAALLGLLLLAGLRLPFIGVLLAPLLVLTHPINLVYPVLALIPAAALAAVGLQTLLDASPTERGQRLRPAMWAVGAGLVAAALHAAGVLGAPHSALGRAHAWGGIAQAAAVAGGAAWLLSRPGRTVAATALLVLGLVDLGAYAARSHAAVPSTPLQSASRSPLPTADLGAGLLDVQDLATGWDSALAEAEAEEADPLLADDPERALGTRPRRHRIEGDVQAPEVDGPAQQADLLGRAFAPHSAMALGVPGLAGRSKLAPARQRAAIQPLAEALHDSAARTYVLQDLFGRPDGLGARTMALHSMGIAAWSDELVFAMPAGPPRCWASTASAVVPESRARVAAALATPRPGDGPDLLESPLPRPPGPANAACNERSATVQADGEALLVWTLPFHPGWAVRDSGGVRLPTVPVHQVRTGVLVPPGEHQLTARFEPPGLRAALLAAAVGWLGLLGLAWRPKTAIALTVLLAAPAVAAPIEGTVLGRDAPGQEVWLVDELDLTNPAQPRARAPVDADGRFVLDSAGDDGRASWLFLHQVIDDAPPQRFLRPLDLEPFAAGSPPPAPRLRAIPAGLATIRAAGRPMPGYWLQPLLLAVLLGGGGLAVRAALGWRRVAAEGARTLLTALRQGPAAADAARDARRQRGPAPLAEREAPPVEPRERRLLLAVLAIGAAVRLRGFTAPLDLLEWTYGPGSRAVHDEARPWLDAIWEAIRRPSSVEVTHPPGYHALLGVLGDSEPLLRLPALLASLGTIAGVWWLLRRLGRAPALIAAATLALCGPAQHFGRDASPYALSGLVALGAVLLAFRALRTGQARDWRLCVGLLVVGFLCHYAVALFGLPLLMGLLVLAVLRGRNPAWSGAGERLLGASLLLLPIPLLWALVHFAWFETVALDTQLFADVYPLDPGLQTFSQGLLAVAMGLPPTATAGTLAGLLLVTRGQWVLLQRDRILGLLLTGLLAGLFGSLLFFHGSLVQLLGGRVFWGFRWVCWALPMTIAFGVVGAVVPWSPQPRRLDLGVRSAAAAVWLAAAVPFALSPAAGSARPDYAGAAELLARELGDRDAVAALPLWGQRGPLRHYLVEQAGGTFEERDGVLTWRFGDRGVFLEAIDERLPFESSARNAHIERLWVAVVDERMFGRPKFSMPVADRAIAWADQRLEPDGVWKLEGITLRRYRRRPGDLVLGPGDRLRLTAPEVDLRSGPWAEPNTPTCQSEEEGEKPRWLLQLRVPTAEGVEVEASVEGGKLVELEAHGAWRAELTGGPCTGPAPVVALRGR